MKITIIGAGYVGLVTGACFAELGHEVTLVEKDLEKVQVLVNGDLPIYEPGLREIFQKKLSEGRISISQNLRNSVLSSRAVIIAVGTPSSRRGEGDADISFVTQVAVELSEFLPAGCIVINKSTVPVGTTRIIRDLIQSRNPEIEFEMASNPEFLREGAAIKDFLQPDRIIVGIETENAEKIMREMYSDFLARELPVLFTSFETAELIKYASNSFLAAKISFINEMAQLCESVGADIGDLSKGMGLDSRIGEKFLQPGPGYGGSCFPKDTVALIKMAKNFGCRTRIVEAAVEVNEVQTEQMMRKIKASLGGLVSGKRLAIWGLTFKADTDDLRESPSLKIITELLKIGVKINAHDPIGMSEAKKIFPEVSFYEDPYLSCKDADGICLLTEWKCYQELDLNRVKPLLKHSLFIDLRNVFSTSQMKDMGFYYVSLGRDEVPVNKIRHIAN